MNTLPPESPAPSILMVDDVPANLKLLAGILSRKGYKVRPVSSGALALRAIEKAPPDLILLDITMPEMDGYEVCQRLKRDEKIASIPVIFLSALNDPEAKIKAFHAGGVDYITKPFQAEEVLARVECQLKIRQLQLSVEKRNRELAETNQRLTEANLMRDNLVHMIVHDMRSPLTVQMGYLDFLMEKASSMLDDGTLSCLVAARQSSVRLVNMVNSMLDISRMETGNLAIRYALNDLTTILSEAMDLYRPIREQRRLTLECPKDLPPVDCDAYLIRRVMENLLGNALRFTKPTGQIHVVLSGADPQECLLKVIDDGVGIAEENHGIIFEKFGQVGPHKKNSSGLGLTFCRLAIEAHGGEIGIESELGNGSTFWFTLPRNSRGNQ
jgi:two-component system, sensor histidine kinase and response regulator